MQAALKQAAENAKSRAVWQDCPLRPWCVKCLGDDIPFGKWHIVYSCPICKAKELLLCRLRGVREARQ